MDQTQPRQSIIRVIQANRETARQVLQRIHLLQRAYRGASPVPERKEPPIGKSVLDLSNSTNSDLTDSIGMLDRMLEDVDMREAQGHAGRETDETAKQWAGDVRSQGIG